jgi:hypothetical protein
VGWEIVYFIVILILSIALAPKPPDAKPASFEDFEFPTAEEGSEIPVLFGENVFKWQNVLWYGGLHWTKIRKRAGFSKTTIGYRYYMSFHAAICLAPVDAVNDVHVKDTRIIAGDREENFVFSYDDYKLFGGDEQEGGLSGKIWFSFGEADQPVPEYTTWNLFGSQLPRWPLPHPAYRGVLTFFYGSPGYVGTSKYPKPWSVRAKRMLKGWYNDEVWYPEKCIIHHKIDMNPAHIIYQCLTDKAWGRGLPATRLNLDTFATAADKLYDEEFGLQFTWSRSMTIEAFIQSVLDQIAGALVWRTSTGKFELYLIRDDYEVSSLFLLDESNVLNVDAYERQAWGETVNELTLKYTSNISWKETAVTAHDLANIEVQGGTNTETIEFKGIRSDELAKRVCLRELSARSTPLAKVTLTCNRAPWDQFQGGVVRWSWSKLGIVDMPLRILKISKGSLGEGTIRIDAVQDIYSLDTITYLVVPDTEDPPENPVLPEDDDTNSASVISTALTAPPSNPQDGDRYYVAPGTGTGAWAGMSGLVEWDANATVNEDGNGSEGAWIQIDLDPGTAFYDEENDSFVSVDPDGELIPFGGGGEGGYPPALGHSGI